MYYLCVRCQKKFEVRDPRPRERFACPYCHCAVLEYDGPPPLNVSRRQLLVIRGKHVEDREDDDAQLLDAREQLLRFLSQDEIGTLLLENWVNAKRLILRWFSAYKKWESKDTFEQALCQGRMTVRYGKRELMAILDPIQAFDGTGKLKKWYVNDKGRVQARDTETEALAPLGNAVGTFWVHQRTKPESYFPVSQKMELGLYDLSATLLHPLKPISLQTFLNANVKSDEVEPENLWFVFAPLSDPRDQVLIRRLSAACKSVPKEQQEGLAWRELRDCVRGIRSMMTRIKFASEQDMGTNFRAYDPKNVLNPKIKYGPGKKAFERFESPEKAMKELSENAEKFRKILLPGDEVNEIVVAYREHSGLFPIFARLDKKTKRFKVFQFTSDMGDHQFTGAVVLDDGRLLFGSRSSCEPPVLTCFTDFTGLREGMELPPLSKRGKTSQKPLGVPPPLERAEEQLKIAREDHEIQKKKSDGESSVSSGSLDLGGGSLKDLEPEKLTDDEHYYTEEEMLTLMKLGMKEIAAQGVVVLDGMSYDDFVCLTPVYNSFPTGTRTVIQPLHVGGNHWALIYITLKQGAAPHVLYLDPLHPGVEYAPDLSPLRRAFPTLQSVEVSNIRYQNDGMIQHSCGAWIVQLALMLVNGNGALPRAPKDPRKFAVLLREQHQKMLDEHKD